MKVSDNEQGNPYHDEEGKFTSPNDAGEAKEKPESEVFGGFGTMELKKEVKEEDKPRLNLSPEMLKNFLAKKKAIQVEKAKTYLESVMPEIDEEKLQVYQSYDFSDKNTLLENSPQGYDKKKLKDLSPEQQMALLCAEDILNKGKSIANEIDLLEKEKEKINTDMATELASSELNQKSFTGIWFSPVSASDYASKNVKDANGKTAIDRKRDYYKDILQSDKLTLVEKAKFTQYLKELDKFEELGKAFEVQKLEVQAKYVDKLEDIETRITNLNKYKEKFTYDSPLVLEASKFIEGYQDKNAAYSKLRKDKATWIDAKWIKAHPEYQNMGIYGAAAKHFGDRFEKMWDSMSSAERNALKDYTSAYSRINEPLRGIKYAGSYYDWNADKFAKAVNNMTEAIDKCVWDEDIWVQRGLPAHTNMLQLPGEKIKRSLNSLPDSKLQSLVGLTFTDPGFYSSGAGKGTGFSGNNLIINTYCPKGTKMAYIAKHSNYTSENEMILQRGYSYRITKIEHKGGQYYMDVEVILGSDSQKPVGNELKALGMKHI